MPGGLIHSSSALIPEKAQVIQWTSVIIVFVTKEGIASILQLDSNLNK
jgi:hypothetical protein